MELLLRNQKIRTDKLPILGMGGEAIVYSVAGEALKVYRQPNDPVFAGDKAQQLAAEQRLQGIAAKLPALQALRLPSNAIQPTDLLQHPKNKATLGYSMPLLANSEAFARLSERQFRASIGSKQASVALLLALYDLIVALHQQNIVLGDFNDQNVMLSQPQGQARQLSLVDLDSAQFGPWACQTFSARFLDPLLMDATGNLAKAYTPAADWYAFAVMLMQTLLLVHPFGGVLAGTPIAERIRSGQHVLLPKVKYPKPADAINTLPDHLLDHLRAVFAHQKRDVFPRQLLALQFQTCPQCGLEHAHTRCPACYQPSHRAIVPIARPSKAQMLFQGGQVLVATAYNGQLSWLALQQGQLRRESGAVVWSKPPDPHWQLALHGAKTLVGQRTRGLLLDLTDGDVKKINSFGPGPVFACNHHHLLWLSEGQLWSQGPLGPQSVGQVLDNRSAIWLGPGFGLGISRAESWLSAFLFWPKRHTILDGLKLPAIHGELLKAHAVLSETQAWLFLKAHVQGHEQLDVVVFDENGQQIHHRRCSPVDLAGFLGATAIANALLLPTDEGVMRIRIENGWQQLLFAETAAFVSSESQLLPAPQGLYVVERDSIVLLTV
jgi:serine/threonine protein kinase